MALSGAMAEPHEHDKHIVWALVRERLAAAPRRRRYRPRRSRPIEPWMAALVMACAGVLMVQLGLGALDELVGPKLGERCVENRDCGDGEFCMVQMSPTDRYCSAPCTRDGDCNRITSCGDPKTVPGAVRSWVVLGAGANGPACVLR